MTTRYNVTHWNLEVRVGWPHGLGNPVPRDTEVRMEVTFDNEDSAREFETKVRALLETT